MTEEKEAKPVTTEAEATPEPKILKIHGKEFDISTDDGLKQAQYWGEAVSTLAGRQSNEIGELRREVEPLRKYNLTRPDFDEIEITQKVEKLRAEGEHVEADRLMFELYRQTKLDTEVQREEDRLWSDYRASRPELFQRLPEDMARDYVFNNYRVELRGEADPFSLLDRILKPKASRIEPSQQSSSEPAATLGAGASAPSTTPAPEAESAATEEGDGAWDTALTELGFK
jgi:hypothetical protein